jgi:hypothetical protein
MSKIDGLTETVEQLGELQGVIKKHFAWVKPTIMSLILMLGGGSILESNGMIDLTPIGEGDDWVWEEEQYYPYYGCTDYTALNYDEYADTEDNSCEYEEEIEEIIYGCTNSSANNYNANATNDDDSCAYNEEEPDPEPELEYCNPFFYELFVHYGDVDNLSILANFDIDCENNSIMENVTVQFLAWTNETNWSNSDGPYNWTSSLYEIEGQQWDNFTLRLANFTNDTYDIYIYLIREDGEIGAERSWMNIPLRSKNEE